MSDIYNHGPRVIEETTAEPSPVNGTAGLQVVFGTAPVNLAKDPYGAVNVPVLCRNMAEAKEKLGFSEDFASFTLCQSMYAGFKAFGVEPVVFVNVLDPAKHRKENSEKEYAVINRQIMMEDVTGVLKDTLVIKNGETQLTEEKDYIAVFDDEGKVIITLISDDAGAATSLKVTSASIDPSLVTEADVIGEYDTVTGKETGFEVLRQVYPRTGMVPGLILAPGWSHKTTVGTVMIAKCEAINGVFTTECVLDLDTAETPLYTSVPKVKEESGYQDKHAIVLWPKVEMDGRQMYYSAAYGAMAAYVDASNDDVPSISPSNRLLRVTKAVLENGTEVYMDREQANTLNGQGIVTVINEGGWRSWGNNMSVYPEVADVKDRWICCRRMFTWMSNSLIRIYHEKVDSPANFRLIESICDSENIRLNSYVAAGKLAGGRIEYNEEENRVENLISGQVVFHIYMAAFTPAEDILFILKFDPALLTESLSGSMGGEA